MPANKVTPANKRKHKRLPIRGFMQCSASFGRNGHQYQAVQVLSLSAGGMYLALDSRKMPGIEQDNRLDNISFDLKELNGLQISGKIAHCMSLGEIAGCGVEFFDLSPEQQMALDRFVEHKLKEIGLWDFC